MTFLPAIYRVKVPLAATSDDRGAMRITIPRGALLEFEACRDGLFEVRRNGKLLVVTEQALFQNCERLITHSRDQIH